MLQSKQRIIEFFWLLRPPSYGPTSETIEVTMYSGSYAVNLFKQKVVSQKNDLFATVTQQSLFIEQNRLSDHLHCANRRPFTYVLRKAMSTLSCWSKRRPLHRLEKMFSTKYHAKSTWPVLLDWSFAMGALQYVHVSTVPWSSGQQRCVWSKTDTLTITTSTSQIIVTSVHYTVIAKALDCEEYLATNLLKWPYPMSHLRR